MQSIRAKRVLIVGARGELGRLAVRAFHAAGWEVQRGIRAAVSDGEVRVEVDRVDSVRGAAAEHELIINTVPHPDLLIERAVLEYGGALINVSALPAAAGRALRAVAGCARGTAVMNAGLVPGVSNLVAAELLRAHPQADELELVLTSSALSTRGPAGAAFIDHGLRALSRHRTVTVPLPEPFGTSHCVGFAEGEAGWLGGVAEGRLIHVYICFAEPEAQRRLLMENATRTTISPTRFRRVPARGRASSEPVAHWVAAKLRGRRVAAWTLKCGGNYLHAARCALVLAENLLEKRTTGGCFDPEEVFTLEELEPALARAGISLVPQPVSRAAAVG